MPLSDLITALAAATGPGRELDAEIAVALFGWRRCPNSGHWSPPSIPYFMPAFVQPPAYTESLDAITGAVRQRWPRATVFSGEKPGCCQAWLTPSRESPLEVEAETAAAESLARCLAAARLAAAEEAR